MGRKRDPVATDLDMWLIIYTLKYQKFFDAIFSSPSSKPQVSEELGHYESSELSILPLLAPRAAPFKAK